MARQEKAPQLLTVPQANDLLPRVRKILAELRGSQGNIRKLEEKKAVEELTWLQPDGSVSFRAKEAVEGMDEFLEKEVRLFEKGLEELSGIGAQLKDLEEGLVDFLAAREDNLVCLCWREGESQIQYWHDLESGFAGRHPLGEF